MDIIDFNKYRKNAAAPPERFREFDDYLEYCLVPEYEEHFDRFRAHAIQLENAFVNIVEAGDRTVLVSIQFPKSVFTISTAQEWLTQYKLDFRPEPEEEHTIRGVGEIVCGVRFRGKPVVLYTKGHRQLSYRPGDFPEITDTYVQYHKIVNTATAREVKPRSKPTIILNGKVVDKVPHIDFDLSQDLILSNGHVMVADYIDDYFGGVGFYQENNDFLPIAFFYSPDAPIVITLREKEDGSKVCIVTQEARINPEEL